MPEPHRKSGHFQVDVSYSFDRLLEAKLAQSCEILVHVASAPNASQLATQAAGTLGNLGFAAERSLSRSRLLRQDPRLCTDAGHAPNVGGV